MEQIAILEGVKEEDCLELNSVVNKIKKGFTEVEAKELQQVGSIVFLHVKQTLYLMERVDGKDGQHFNLTQLLIETEIDSNSGLVVDYQVAVFF